MGRAVPSADRNAQENIYFVDDLISADAQRLMWFNPGKTLSRTAWGSRQTRALCHLRTHQMLNRMRQSKAFRCSQNAARVTPPGTV